MLDVYSPNLFFQGGACKIIGIFHQHQHPTVVDIQDKPPQAPPERILGMRASDIDKYSRVIFPITFLTFHMTYWSIFLTISGACLILFFSLRHFLENALASPSLFTITMSTEQGNVSQSKHFLPRNQNIKCLITQVWKADPLLRRGQALCDGLAWGARCPLPHLHTICPSHLPTRHR